MPFINDRLQEQADAQREAEGSGGPESERSSAAVSVGRVDADRVRQWLTDRIYGQPDAIDAIHRTLQVVQAGLTDSSRPLASHLFVGPTGTGKTEMVRQLAAILRAGPDDFCRIDMSAMAQEHYAASFAGAPPGYAGSKEGSSIFKRDQIEGDMTRPGIVLFDEIEKAHATVVRTLLHVLDHGVLRLANGQERFNFRNCIVFMTSNLGSREIRDLQQGRLRHWLRSHGDVVSARLPAAVGRIVRHKLDGRLDEVTQQALENHFDPEFLNRLDEVTTFLEFTPTVARMVVAQELSGLRRRLERNQVHLSYGDDVIDHVTKTGFDPVYGARSVRREIRHTVAPLVSRHVIAHRTRRLDVSDSATRIVLGLSRADAHAVRHLTATATAIATSDDSGLRPEAPLESATAAGHHKE